MTGIHKLYRRDNVPFTVVPNDAIRDPEPTPGAFRLLAYLMSHQDGYDLAYGQIEAETSLGRYAINAAIDLLTAKGWLKTERTKMPNGQYGPKAWTVLTPTSASVDDSTAGDSTVEQPTDNKKNIPLEEKDLEVIPQPAVEGLFNEFWSLYPRKVEKLSARKAFEKAYRENGPVVLDGVKRLAADPYLPPKQFVKHPASWLNAGGWDDEPFPVRELTADEKRDRELAAIARRNAADKAHNDRVRAEIQDMKASASPPPVCRHGVVLVKCLICIKEIGGK